MKCQLAFGRSLLSSVVLAGALLFAASAWADGVYLDVHGGTSLFNEDSARVTTLSGGGSVHAHNNFDPGWLAGGAVGFESSNGLAAELEYTFRQNHLNRIASTTPLFVGGDIHTSAFMLNGYYRFLNRTHFTPYIGGGFGELLSTLNNTRPTFGPNQGPFGGSQVTLAYQGILGLSYPLMPHLSLATEYRYLAPTSRPGIEQRGIKVSPDYDSHNAILKLTYHFE